MKKFEGYQKGINLGGWLSQCPSYEKVHFDIFIQKADIDKIASWGFDHVRLPIDYDVLMDDDMNWKPEALTHIDDCIKWCQENGLHMVLDLHKTKGYMFDSNAVSNPNLFFEEVSLQDFFVETWKVLAERYGAYHNMMSFELLNEVTNPAYAVKWNEIARRTTIEIRKIAPDSYILIGGARNNSAISVPELDAPYDDKIVYNFHCYDPLIFTHQKACWVDGMPSDFEMHYPATLEELKEKGRQINLDFLTDVLYDKGISGTSPEMFEAIFKEAIETAEKYDVPLYCGEYGVIDEAPLGDTLRWLQDIHTVFEKHGISRALWSYKQMNFGLSGEHYDNIRAAFISMETGKTLE